MLRRCLSLMATCSAIALAARGAHGDLLLVQNGQPRSIIVTPAEPNDVVQLAAEELQYHLRKMSGAAILIVADGQPVAEGLVRIYVGPSVATRSLGIDETKLPSEGIVVKAVAGALVLLGDDRPLSPNKEPDPFDENCRTGTLFAVYDLLQDHLGVRWLWPGEGGEVIPKRRTVEVPDLDIEEAPRLLKRQMRNPFRESYFERDILPAAPDADREAFLKKGREQFIWGRRMRLGRNTVLRFGHAFTRWWERYGEEHPEYFGLTSDHADGSQSRTPPTAGPDRLKMCVSQPKLWEQLVANWQEERERNADHPEVARTLNACENDGSQGFCECEACAAWDVPGRMIETSSGPKLCLSDRYVRFWNELAKRMREIDPNSYVCGYAYSRYRMPPEKTKVLPGVLLGYVGDPGYPSEPGARDAFRAQWQAWGDAGAELLYRPNVLHSDTAIPKATPVAMAQDLQFFIENGCKGTDYDSLLGYWSTAGPNYYVVARIQWDTEADPAHLADEYYSAFGPAEAKVREYFAYWAKLAERFWGKRDRVLELGYGSGSRGRIRILPEIYREEDFAKGFRILDEAENAAGNDAPVRARVEFLRKGLEHGLLTWRAIRDTEAMKAGDADVETLQKLAKNVGALLAMRKQIEATHITNPVGWTAREISRGDLSGIRIVGAVAGREPIALLPRGWKLRWDPADVGVRDGWWKADASLKDWLNARTDRPWEQDPVGREWKQKHGEDYDGVAWYRTSFRVDPKHERRRIILFFNAVDGDADIWLNGEKAGAHPLVEPDDWKVPFEIDLTGKLRYGEGSAGVNQLAVRVNAEVGMGGIYKRVWLVTEPL